MSGAGWTKVLIFSKLKVNDNDYCNGGDGDVDDDGNRIEDG